MAQANVLSRCSRLREKPLISELITNARKTAHRGAPSSYKCILAELSYPLCPFCSHVLKHRDMGVISSPYHNLARCRALAADIYTGGGIFAVYRPALQVEVLSRAVVVGSFDFLDTAVLRKCILKE